MNIKEDFYLYHNADDKVFILRVFIIGRRGGT